MSPRAGEGDLPPDSQRPSTTAPLRRYVPARRDAALILSVERYGHLPPRGGAHQLAADWYEHFRRHRGLSRRRLIWLKDEAVDAKAVAEALGRVHWRIGEDATLWIIFIGHAAHGPAAPAGWLLGRDSTTPGEAGVPLAQLLARASHGIHRQLVAVIDGCLPVSSPSPEWVSGVPAILGPPLSPRLKRPPRAPSSGPVSLGQAMAEAVAEMMQDVDLRRREPTDSVLFTAGVGERCASPRPNIATLARILLDILRAPTDLDGDGALTVTEALHALRMAILDHQPLPRPILQVHGADIALASARSTRSERALVAPVATSHAAHPIATDNSPLLEYTPDHMILIDRGRFTQGCASRRDRGCEGDERPSRRITLDRFKIDPIEVTWSAYTRCVDAGACRPIDPALCEVWTGDAFVRGAPIPERFIRPDHPVFCVTWYDARDYCEWTGGRLPTESEWERVAKGADKPLRHPWGAQAPTCELARFYGCGDGPAPVGASPRGASPEGALDLAGNVAEWVADWYHPRAYRFIPSDNPAGPDRGRVRVVRGGSFYDPPEQLRSSYRYGLTPAFGYGFVGMRCAR